MSVVHASDEGQDLAVRRAPFGRRIALLVCLALLGLSDHLRVRGRIAGARGHADGPESRSAPSRRFGTRSPRRLHPRRRLLLCRRISRRRLRLRRGKRGRRSEKSWPSISAGSRSASARSLRRPPRQPWCSSRNDRAARRSSARSLAQVSASQTISLPSALQFFLALMIGVSVLVAALAAAPRRALPRPLLGVAGGQRELLFFVAIALDAAAGFVLLVYVLAVS